MISFKWFSNYVCILFSDSTAQYIHGYESVQCDGGIYKEGLQCVVVLIGAYNLHTGQPIVGVLNQPFSYQNPQTKEYVLHTFTGIQEAVGCYLVRHIVSSKHCYNTVK